MKLTRREFVKLGLAAGASLVLPKFARADNPPSVLWIGWDGADYRTVSALLRKGLMPNLANLNTVRLDCVGATVTKPGWVEIITGYEYDNTEVYHNCIGTREGLLYAYKPVPREWILFYRIKQEMPTYWCGCIFSKWNHTGDALGEPWENLRSWGLDGMEYYKNAREGGDGEVSFTIEETNEYLFGEALPSYNDSGGPGLMFCHYSRPDKTGHIRGMDSPRYLYNTKELDEALGQAIATMNPQPDIVIVCSDHGFDGPGATQHHDAPHGFISCNLPLGNNCVRRDVGYTVSKLVGLPVQTYDPPLRGKDMRKV